MAKERNDFKYEAIEAYAKWINKWVKYRKLLEKNKTFSEDNVFIEIYEKDGEKEKFILCIISDESQFESIHQNVRAIINPSKHNDWRGAYVQYVIKSEDFYNEIKKHLLEKAEPNTTHDYLEHHILYHIHYLKDGILERIH